MSSSIPLVDNEICGSIRAFLHRESLALDEGRFRDWLAAFAPDARYAIPVPVTREEFTEWELSPAARIFDRPTRTREFGVDCLAADFAWYRQPRSRHVVTDVVVVPSEDRNGFRAFSNCLLYRDGDAGDEPGILSVQRTDLLRRNGTSWMIVHRRAVANRSITDARDVGMLI